MRDMSRAIRRIARLYDFFLDDHDQIYKVRRVIRKKKKFKGPPKKKMKFGIQVPRTVEEALTLDKANGDTRW